MSRLSSFKRPARTTTIALASAAAGVALAVPGAALANHGGGWGGGHDHAVPAPPAQPTSDNQIQNLDQVKTGIKAYYGDTATTTPDPVDGSTMLHQFAANGAYAQQTEGIAAKAEDYLARKAHRHARNHGHGHWHGHSSKPAILFDVDDTTLNTYSYEIYSNFVYNPTSNAKFVNAGLPVADGGSGVAHPATIFPGVPGMADLEAKAVAEGYQVFFLTGRPASQLAGTEANLTDAGFTFDAANIYLKDQTKPWLSSCAPTCTTTQYKSLTRKYIESQGYDIVANFGDQFSDLNGGYADKAFKMPNPMYYLP